MNAALMIDIETLSLRPDAYVTQIGFCISDLDTKAVYIEPVNLWISDEGQEQRHKDIDTIRFWMRQEDKVRAAVFVPPADQIVTAKFAFETFASLFETYAPTVWASPVGFDLPILTSLWGGAKPWHYGSERDLKTLSAYLDPLKLLRPPANEMLHNASADAAWQMEYLLNLHARYTGKAVAIA